MIGVKSPQGHCADTELTKYRLVGPTRRRSCHRLYNKLDGANGVGRARREQGQMAGYWALERGLVYSFLIMKPVSTFSRYDADRS